MIGGETLLGQVATLIETLHLSYEDVFERIPYKTLLIMQKDRAQCVNTDEIVVRMTGRDFAARRMGGGRAKEVK